MPPSPAEDPDPLLSFSEEPGAAPPPEAAGQLVAPAVDPVRDSSAAPPIEPLQSRIDRLEHALELSRAEVSSLKSEVMTLVRSFGDIEKQMSQRRAASGTLTPQRGTRWALRAAAAIAGIVIGVSAAIFGWMLLSSGADVTIAAPAQIADPSPVPDAPIAVETPKPVEAEKPVDTPTAPKARARGIPAAAAAPRYVGTLSIDAAPGGEVFLNRQSAGHTPLRLTNLRAGSHLIWIERDGYRRWTRVVQVPADRVSRVSAELDPVTVR